MDKIDKQIQELLDFFKYMDDLDKQLYKNWCKSNEKKFREQTP